LKITASLQCGIVCEPSLPFDQIISKAAILDAYGVEAVTAPIAVLQLDPVPPPLAVLNPGPLWYYAASWAQWPAHTVPYTTYWHKRFNLPRAIGLLDPKNRQQKIRPDALKYKAYRMPTFSRHALSIYWYAVGDGEEIQRLLTVSPFIGKNTAQGEGSILRWHVEQVQEDWSIWGPNHQLMRNIPTDDNTGIRMGIRPSYWDPANTWGCLVPEG
jgi:CRISPR type IV-associated protein Csf3